ncbi:MAG TPA: hypothetical protein VHW71_10540 [Steroidobacteraceae bacterium]|jgi:hypothetical protein|nr:hypothetical protein [Steroidobacteraceae bacterium]
MSQVSAYFAALALAFASAQACLVMLTKPWPLQLFMPLQLFFADLHSDIPLQEFTPVHFTVAASAANAVVLIAVVNSIAAAAAMAALDILLNCIFGPSIVIERSGIAAHIKDPANGRIITRLAKLMPVSIGRRQAPGGGDGASKMTVS